MMMKGKASSSNSSNSVTTTSGTVSRKNRNSCAVVCPHRHNPESIICTAIKDARDIREKKGSSTTRIFKASDVEFSLHEIYGDGNCLFRAISYILWRTESRHRYLRSLVVNHIVSTWSEIKPFVQAEWSIASLREYMSFMEADGTFASELECLIATKLNRLNLAIYRRADTTGNLRCILYSEYNRRARTANLLFSGRNEFGHYDVLLPVR